MHVSANGVRLAALVAAATASGYLWRAALEPSQGTTIIRLAPAESHPQVVVQPAHLPPPSGPAVTLHRQPRATARQRSRPMNLVAERTAAPAARTYVPQRPAPRPAPAPKPKPSPKPDPNPSPSPPPPATPPSAPPPESPPSTEETATASASSPPSTTEPSTQETGENEDSKPGWGHGDKNHHHDGPHDGKHD